LAYQVRITARLHHHIAARQQVSFQNGLPVFQQLLIDRFVEGFAVFQLVDTDHHRLRQRVTLAESVFSAFTGGEIQMQHLNLL
jgi:hypothetical protein